MRHDFTLEGFAYRLRPISNADASFVLQLRSNSHLNQFLHTTSPNLQDQMNWFSAYYERAGDYYFVIERKDSSSPEGLISLYDVNFESKKAEWGRWILKPGSLAAVESALAIYTFGFEQLQLSQIYCRTVSNNKSVVSFHDSCGIQHRKVLKNHFKIGEHFVDAVEHLIDLQSWPQVQATLKRLAELTSRRLTRA